MIIVFLIFTILSILFQMKKSENFQQAVPFYIVSTISWISILLYMYVNDIVILLTIFEVASFFIIIAFGNNLEKFYQFKFLSFLILSLSYLQEGIYLQDIFYIYVVVSFAIGLNSKFKIDKKISFPFMIFNGYSLLKAKEFIDSPLSINIYIIGMVALFLLIIKSNCKVFRVNSIFLNLLLWLGLFTFSLDLYFLYTSVTILLSISLLSNLEIKTSFEDVLLYCVSLIILIPLAKISLPLSLLLMASFTMCLFINQRNHLSGICHE